MKVLVAGATGYVGGRLIPRLLEEGYAVRALGRSKAKLAGRVWGADPRVELVEGDVQDCEAMTRALEGCDVCFYLVHSMLPGQKDFESADRTAAMSMRQAAEKAGVKRIIYLSGLGEHSADLSRHLKSRFEVAEILSEGKVPVTVLRAAMIIGSGSASFEILRYLVDRLPAMITPRWVGTPSQPIAIRNVIEYLAGCVRHPETAGRTFDIGGPRVLTYRELMEIYAREAGLPKRFIVPVPFLTPRLSSYWIHLVTPVPASIARPLAEGLRNPVVCTEHEIEKIIPQKLLSPEEAIARALKLDGEQPPLTSWTDAGRMPVMESADAGDPAWAGGTLLKDVREIEITGREKDVWARIVSIGGENGWYYANALWAVRGFLDKMAGGVGLRRGRRDPHFLRVGDALDFWRVMDIENEKRLLLAAEMKLPGRATLQFTMHTRGGRTFLEQKAIFRPRGLLGIAYWYLLYPVHCLIFSGMLRSIAGVKSGAVSSGSK